MLNGIEKLLNNCCKYNNCSMEDLSKLFEEKDITEKEDGSVTAYHESNIKLTAEAYGCPTYVIKFMIHMGNEISGEAL